MDEMLEASSPAPHHAAGLCQSPLSRTLSSSSTSSSFADSDLYVNLGCWENRRLYSVDSTTSLSVRSEISSDSEGSEEQMPPWQNIRPEAHIAEPMSSRKNSRDGYLLKQGGHNANRGWRRRWVVFNGASLSYYSDNTSQVSIRIIPIKCMTEVEADIKQTDKDNFRFKLHTTLKNRIFLFASDTRDDCLNWALTLGAAITEYKKLPVREVQPEKPDKEGFVRINSSSKKYYVSITGPTLQYYHSLEDYHIGSPIHQIDMKLASVKVKERKKCKLQLATHYRYFEFTFDDDSEMQNWYMAMEDAIAEGLADDTVLEKVYDNLSNKNCADCGAENPHWASINLGIVVCKNCAGVHRAFDYRVSKIKSLRMDTRVWTPSLIELMVTIGNANANAFWEFTLPPGMKAQPKDSMEKRKEYITKKYIGKKFSNLHELHSMGPQALGKELVSVAGSADVLDLMKILFSGAQVLYRINNCGQTAYEVAKDSGQRLNMELLYQNSGDPQSQLESVSDENRLREDIRLQGYLNKTGPMRGKFESRWCVLEHGSLTYYANEKSTTFKGTIDRKEMCMIQSVESDKIGYHFELSTTMKENRIFSFSSDCKEDAGEWIRTIAKLMAPIAVMEHVGMIDIKFAGAAHMRESLSQDWQQTFLVFSWRGLNYMNRDLKFDYLDLRKASGIKKQLTGDGYQKQGPYFVISSTVKSVYIQATLPRDTEQMFLALSQAISESGRTLHDQALTSKSVPVIVDKCIAYITTHGLKEKGIYRQTGQLSRVQTLLDEFRKDAHSVVLTNYTVHEVAGALKKFLRELDDSVFERNNYGNWIEAAGSKDEQHRMGLYKYYLGRMPEVNRQTLKAVILHLLDIAQNEHENSMSITNLATCFAPSLLRTQLDELQFASETASREISIILDILKNRDFFFKVDEKDTIVENNIRDALLKMKKGSIKGSTDNVNTPSCMLTPVLLLGESDHSVNISVTPEKIVHDGLIEALANFRRNNRNLEIRNYILEEQLFDGMLERPLFNEELISKTTVRWLEWSSFYDRGINMRLCLRNTDIMENLKKSALHSFLSNIKLNYKDPSSKKFSKKTVGFRQLKLVLFKSSEAKDESVSWNAEDITVYIGTMLKKNLPSGCKFFLTFIVNGEDISNNKDKERSFGHCFGFETETEMMKWSAAIYSAQHPASF
ncbi:arf-GAP with Rho-GAP domain ANK repeat and PH domain-containing protein 1-like isoform X2 [Biomphalaria pfeifferi]|uniref:Arf-GAP with Rho-GAP domain ANK repeat and PH domain-containing protein 1-like isoform X2 n=1 Tax=Biomphalaria pfeifferi TaxID=112525 RepID=A0AAD8ASL4_BIOPF|nr:arf-GAP with Rho-GAP domain ANK repeat and PH domain-containing protein 1-like isoform X2 [Biomphalaria pfeifferi]